MDYQNIIDPRTVMSLHVFNFGAFLWFSPGTPASSTTKTGRHDIAEILLKVALKHQISNQIKKSFFVFPLAAK